MNNTTARNLRFLTISALLACAGSLHAAESVEVPWNDFCRVAGSRQLEIMTSSGETVMGYCVSITADEVGVSFDNRIVKISRAALSHIQIERSQGNQLKALGRGVRKALNNGVTWLLSPSAPAGIVAIPVALAWGAVAAPFCILGDLKHHLLGKQEIKLI
jgi:hypothetical protein